MHLIYQGGVFTAKAENRQFIVASNSDIVPDILENRADFALLGSDKFGELPDETMEKLLFESVGKLTCNFVLAVPIDTQVCIAKLRVATSYPRALEQFLDRAGIVACEVLVRAGKVEGAIAQGIADAIFDITETGRSLEANGLKPITEDNWLELGGLWLAK